jgi:hypothetical protein
MVTGAPLGPLAMAASSVRPVGGPPGVEHAAAHAHTASRPSNSGFLNDHLTSGRPDRWCETEERALIPPGRATPPATLARIRHAPHPGKARSLRRPAAGPIVAPHRRVRGATLLALTQPIALLPSGLFVPALSWGTDAPRGSEAPAFGAPEPDWARDAPKELFSCRFPHGGGPDRVGPFLATPLSR